MFNLGYIGCNWVIKCCKVFLQMSFSLPVKCCTYCYHCQLDAAGRNSFVFMRPGLLALSQMTACGARSLLPFHFVVLYENCVTKATHFEK